MPCIPRYLCPEKTTGKILIQGIPDKLLPYWDELEDHLTKKFQNEPLTDDLLFAANWEVYQWICAAMDNHGIK